MDIEKLRKYAKEITLELEIRGYTFVEADLLVAILKGEIMDCKKERDKNTFLAIR